MQTILTIAERHGALGLLCRLSFSPDFCVRRTEEVFARVGSWSLLFAKFIPGLSLITVAMAGVTKMTVLAFLLLDGIGALLFISAAVALGLLFQDAITSVLSKAYGFGEDRRPDRPRRNWIVYANKMVAAAIVYPSASHG